MRVAVLGAGSWGTTLAALATARADVVLWARDPAVAAAVRDRHENPGYAPGVALPPALRATADVAEALAGADLVVVAVPSQYVRGVVTGAAPHVPAGVPVLSVAKGVERGSCRRMTEVLAEVLAGHDPAAIGVLAGPNLAREIAAGQPAATCMAFPAMATADALQHVFMGDVLRVYTSDDVLGCEIGGAVKNVIAIAAGVADGLGYGDNTKAALITRGLAELTRLGVALGGQPMTFLGLAGNGDLIATCTSPQSRNRHVGVELGRGRPLADVVGGMHMVAEGVATAPVVVELAARVGVEMPICETVVAVLDDRLAPRDIVPRLMRRDAKRELHGLGG